MTRWLRGPRRDERGQVGGVEMLPLGVLVLLVGALLVVNAWAVVDAKMSTASSAREAARAYVEAADTSTALPDAEAAARDTIEGLGRDPRRLEIRQTAGSFARCQRVRFEASYPVPAITLPWIGGAGGDVFVVRSAHTEIVDPYRSGLPGEAGCG